MATIYVYDVYDDGWLDMEPVADKTFDKFEDAYDYAQGGAACRIYEFPVIDGQRDDDDFECVWAWDDCGDRDESIAKVAARRNLPEAYEEPGDPLDYDVYDWAGADEIDAISDSMPDEDEFLDDDDDITGDDFIEELGNELAKCRGRNCQKKLKEDTSDLNFDFKKRFDPDNLPEFDNTTEGFLYDMCDQLNTDGDCTVISREQAEAVIAYVPVFQRTDNKGFRLTVKPGGEGKPYQKWKTRGKLFNKDGSLKEVKYEKTGDRDYYVYVVGAF